jgi:small subunit ribosomal protein S8
MNDLLSDFVARVNNAVAAGHDEMKVLKNNLIISVCKKMVTLGYFKSYEVESFVVNIKLDKSKIKKLVRISKPGRRVYVSFKKLPKIVGGIGWNILSTSKGIVTNFEAKRDMIGGELLFQIV